MYACLHGPGAGRLAGSFSPFVEKVDEQTAVFSITPAQLPLLADVEGISVGIAPVIEAAVLAARHRTAHLGSLPVDVLAADVAILATLDLWGIRTLADLARLPEEELAARLGPEGVRLQQLARGTLHRPLRPWAAPAKYEAGADLDYSIDRREPLLFLIGQFVHELAGRLESQSLAAQALHLRLNRQERRLRLPFPTRDTKLLLKLIGHSLERQAPGEPVSKVHLEMIPAAPRRIQHALFTPAAPEPEKLELTLEKIRALVGEANVGYPELFDSYRPGTGRLAHFWPPLALRRLRPPQEMSRAFKERIVRRSGPWRTSGEWWREDAWDHDEWDVVLRDGSLYRVYRERRSGRWFVDGEYD